MSELAKYRTHTQHTLKGVAKILTDTVDKRLKAPQLCNIEQGVVNPTPKTLKVLAALYGTSPDRLLSYDEVNYEIAPPPESNPSKNALRLRESRRKNRTKNFCVAVPVEMTADLDAKLKACGYHNRISWFMLKLKALDVEYGKIAAAKRRAKERPVNAKI